MIKNFLLVVSLLSFCLSCDKIKRMEFPQGIDSDLQDIAKYDNQSLTLKTFKNQPIANPSAPSDPQKVVLKGINSGQLVLGKNPPFNDFKEVSFEVYSEDAVAQELGRALLNGVKIVARPESEFRVVYRLEDNYFKIYLVGNKGDLPFQSYSYAKNFGIGGGIALPLVGFPISYYQKVQDDGAAHGGTQRTQGKINQIRSKIRSEVNRPFKQGSTHFRMNPHNPIFFKTYNKENVFPASLFEGDWFYASTVTSAAIEHKDEIGQMNSQDERRKPIGRVRFIKLRDAIKAVSLNVDERIELNDEESLEDLPLIIKIPVNWIDYKIAKQGPREDLEEAILNGDNQDDIPWKDLKLIKINFSGIISSLEEKNSVHLRQFIVDNDYIGIKLYSEIDKTETYHSFRRAYAPKLAANYPNIPDKRRLARTAFKSDQKVFGYFSTQKNYIEGYANDRRESKLKFNFLNRFMPFDNKIVYHLTKNSPKNLRATARAAIVSWNTVFKNVDSGIEVQLDESFDVDLGDTRYNSINFIDTLGGTNLYGFGPSVDDTDSGEIIAATANIYVNPMRSSMVRFLRNYVMNQLGMLNQKSISVAVSDLIKSPAGQQIAKTGNTVAAEGSTEGTAGSQCSFGNTFGQLIAVLENAIKEGGSKACAKIPDYVERVQRQNLEKSKDPADIKSYLASEEVPVLEACANELLPNLVLETLIHELGHNFGLRHNFKGSYDKANFLKVSDQLKPAPESSTVMDYLASGAIGLPQPGPYDIAAIRFGYAEGLENDKGDIQKIDSAKSIKDNLTSLSSASSSAASTASSSTQNFVMKNYLFCTDENTEGLDPFCNLFDRGTNASEIVDNYINEYWERFERVNYKLDHMTSETGLGRKIEESPGAINLKHFFLPLRKIYNHWRHQVADFLPNQPYLQNLSVDEYQQVLNDMKSNPHFAPSVQAYQSSASKIFHFFKDLAFSSNKYCVLQKNSEEVVEDFENLRKIIFKETGETINNCTGAKAQELVAKNPQLGFKLLKEFGHPLNNLKESLAVEDFNGPTTYTGNIFDRKAAFMLLNSRQPFSKLDQPKSFFPNFCDEPLFRQELIDAMMDRLQFGVPVPVADLAATSLKNSSYDRLLNVFPGEKSLASGKANAVYAPKFQYEKELIKFGLESLLGEGLDVPGHLKATHERLTLLLGMAAKDPKNIPASALAINLGGIFYFADPKFEPTSYAILARFQKINSMSKIDEAALQEITGDVLEDLSTAYLSFLANLPQSESELDTVSSLNFAKSLKTETGILQKALSSLSTNQIITTLINEVVFNDLNQYFQAIGASLPNAVSNKSVSAFFGPTSKEFYLKRVVKNKQDLLSQLKLALEKVREDFHLYQSLDDDFQAQMELLQTFMRHF